MVNSTLINKSRVYLKGVYFRFAFFVAVVCCSCSAVQVNSQGLPVINAINHEAKTLVINDSTYVMPISLDVVVYNTKTKKVRSVNRYALKKDLPISFKAEIRSGLKYVTKITIYEN